jgi:hypothetical protein
MKSGARCVGESAVAGIPAFWYDEGGAELTDRLIAEDGAALVFQLMRFPIAITFTPTPS